MLYEYNYNKIKKQHTLNKMITCFPIFLVKFYTNKLRQISFKYIKNY